MNDFNVSTKIDIEGDKDFYKLAQLIGENIQKIIHNVSSMNKIVMKLNKIQDAPHFKQDLRKISNYTQQLTKDTSHNLKELCKIRHSSETEQMRFKIHKERLTERFKSALSEFEAAQCIICDKENELMKLTKSSAITQILPPPPRSSRYNDYSTFKNIKNKKNSQSQLQIQYSVDPKLLQRHHDVLQIENDVKEVHALFLEVSEYVDKSRPMVDAIEDHVLESDALIDQGNMYLHEASRYKSKFRKRSCYLSIICTVIILIIIYFVFIK